MQILQPVPHRRTRQLVTADGLSVLAALDINAILLNIGPSVHMHQQHCCYHYPQKNCIKIVLLAWLDGNILLHCSNSILASASTSENQWAMAILLLLKGRGIVIMWIAAGIVLIWNYVVVLTFLWDNLVIFLLQVYDKAHVCSPL